MVAHLGHRAPDPEVIGCQAIHQEGIHRILLN